MNEYLLNWKIQLRKQSDDRLLKIQSVPKNPGRVITFKLMQNYYITLALGPFLFFQYLMDTFSTGSLRVEHRSEILT